MISCLQKSNPNDYLTALICWNAGPHHVCSLTSEGTTKSRSELLRGEFLSWQLGSIKQLGQLNQCVTHLHVKSVLLLVNSIIKWSFLSNFLLKEEIEVLKNASNFIYVYIHIYMRLYVYMSCTQTFICICRRYICMHAGKKEVEKCGSAQTSDEKNCFEKYW